MRASTAVTKTPIALALIAITAAAQQSPDGVVVEVRGPDAFSYPVPALGRLERRAFAVGNSFFRNDWVEAPSSTAGRDGLGPLFNARSCSGCHVRDGRGRPPLGEREPAVGLVARLGLRTQGGAIYPHPSLGAQLQTEAIAGFAPEGRLAIHHEEVGGTFGSRRPYQLDRLRFAVDDPDADPKLLLAGRVAPQLAGVGLLEAVAERDLLAVADPDDRDGDGISGRARRVEDLTRGTTALGRFGWKASQPSVLQQTARAFADDIGITSALFPAEPLSRAELTPDQRRALRAVSGGDPEIDAHKLERVAFYCRTLAAPAPRHADDPRVARGRAVFAQLGCAACHRPSLRTSPDAAIPALRDRPIAPYTDLLLHDLGPALADPFADGDAGAAEWRTPPLWGIGLIEEVNGHTRYLHDGRARDLEEAVLWHGGEARPATDRYRHATAAERAALLAFLRSL